MNRLFALCLIVTAYGFAACSDDFRNRPIRDIHAMPKTEQDKKLEGLSQDERKALEAGVMENLKDTALLKSKTINELIEQGKKLRAERSALGTGDSNTIILK